MSWNENGRKNRMFKILELLKLNPQGLALHVIASETGKGQFITLIGMDKLSFLNHAISDALNRPLVFSKRSLSSGSSCTLKS